MNKINLLPFTLISIISSDFCFAEDIVISNQQNQTLHLNNTSGGTVQINADINPPVNQGYITNAIVIDDGSWDITINNTVNYVIHLNVGGTKIGIYTKNRLIFVNVFTKNQFT